MESDDDTKKTIPVGTLGVAGGVIITGDVVGCPCAFVPVEKSSIGGAAVGLFSWINSAGGKADPTGTGGVACD